MLGFLLAFLGLSGAAAAGAGGGGGGSKDQPVRDREVIVKPQVPETPAPAPEPDTSTDDDHDDDHMAQDDDDGHAHHDDDQMAQDDDDGHAHHDGDHMAQDDDDGHAHHDDDQMAQDDDDGHAHHDDDQMAQDDDDGHAHHDDDQMAEDDGADHPDHDDDHMAEHPIDLPTNAAEIDAFVAAVRASPEMHSHDHGSSMAGEHMAAMNLVPRDEATHIAIGNGAWDNPANWHNGVVPGDDARVLIPEGVHITYDHVSDTSLFTVRVDGKLEFATDTDSQMIVDTLVVSTGGTLEIGTEADPVDANVNVDIIFANNGPIDTAWDPMLLSRGMIAHGKVDIHGAMKDSHEKVVVDPMKGDTWVDMGETPEGWAVGDTVVIAGTRYEGYTRWDPAFGYTPSEDEVRVITQIEDGMIFFDEPLVYDHATPRDDLKTSVANYTRNVSFETEDAEWAEVHERGHVMFMHNDDVDVRYAEFHELGRTDKSEPARNVSEFEQIDFDSNVKGRYSFHFHRAGVDDPDEPGMSIGNAVFGSPGWGFVHHDSHAIFENNATFDTFGAGYVAESGNETGAWTDNIAIYAKGTSWKNPKDGNNPDAFDLGQTGDGFWFQGRMVDSIDNIAASVNNGFVYFHRGGVGENANISFDPALTPFPSLFHYDDLVRPDNHPILGFHGNETFASQNGLFVLKANSQQFHDVHTVLDDFTAWSVRVGAELSYTAHYTLKDFDLVGNDTWSPIGINFGANVSDIAIVDATFDGFEEGVRLKKAFTTGAPKEAHEFTIVNPTFKDVEQGLAWFNAEYDTVIAEEDIPYLKPDIELDGPLTYNAAPVAGGRQILISGTKQDSLGVTDFPNAAENLTVGWEDTITQLRNEGYYTTSDGQDYFMLDLFFSDRLTGDIYLEKHPVFLDNVGFTAPSFYQDTPYNGVADLGGPDDPTIDDAILWATLTEGKLTLTDEAIALEDAIAAEEEAMAHDAMWDHI